jgi:hypothetical protein
LKKEKVNAQLPLAQEFIHEEVHQPKSHIVQAANSLAYQPNNEMQEEQPNKNHTAQL